MRRELQYVHPALRIGENSLAFYGERLRLVAVLISGSRLYLDTWRAFDGTAHRYVLAESQKLGAYVTREIAAHLLKRRQVRATRHSLRLVRTKSAGGAV